MKEKDMKARWLLPLMVIMLMSTMLVADPPVWIVMGGTEYSMVVMADITLYGEPFEGVGENMAGAFGPHPTLPPPADTCRSVAVWQTFPPPIGGFWYFTIVGNEAPGETDIWFRIYDEATDLVYDCNETVPFEDGTTWGDPTTELFYLTAPPVVNPGWIAGNVTLEGGTGNVEDVLVSADGYSTNPDPSGDYTLEVPAGIYDVTASLEGYATVTEYDVEVLENETTYVDFTLHEYMGPPNWIVMSGTEFSMVVMATVNFFGEEFTDEGDNMVGAFGPHPTLPPPADTCRSVAVWEDSVWGFWYMTVVSNDNSGTEVISFKIYDTGTDQIYSCEETVFFEDNIVIGTPDDPLLLNVGPPLPEPPDWVPMTGTQYSMIFFSEILLPSGEVWDSTGSDMFASFGPHPTLPPPADTCRGLGIFYEEVDGPGYWFMVIVGNVEGEEISFKIWDSEEDSIYDCAETVVFEDNIVIGDPDNPFILHAGVLPPPIWTPISGQYNMIMMTEVWMLPDWIEFVDDTGNLLGAFGYENGEINEDDCRALGAWENDDFWYLTIGSMDGVSEPIGFKIYDGATGTIYPCNEYVIFEPDAVIGTPDEPFILTTTTEPGDHQYVDLQAPWTWLSFNIHPDDTSIESVFGVDGNIYQVKTRDISATWYNGVWYGTLDHIADGIGYMAKAVEPTQLHLTGTRVDYTTPIPLTQEWNWIGYLPLYPNYFETAIASVIENADQIKSQTQSATKYYDHWYGNLVWMEPGKGYKIHMTAEDSLIYELGKSGKVEELIATDWNIMTAAPYNMVVMADIDVDPTSVVGVFDNEDICHGIGKWEAYGEDGFWYFTVVGDDNTKGLFFKVVSDGITYESNESFAFVNDETIGNPDEPLTVTLSSGVVDIPEVYSLGQNYPNPFNPATTICFDLPHDATVKLTVYNIKGQEVMSIEKDITAGYGKTISVDMSRCASGIYFYRISTKDYTATKKMLLMK